LPRRRLAFVAKDVKLLDMHSRIAPSFPRRLLVASLTVILWARSAPVAAASDMPGPGVGAQYDGAHVYVAPADMDAFVKSFVATFGGAASPVSTTQVTPTPSTANFIAVRTPVGTLSVLAFTTPIPWPFGSERTGYLVRDMDAAITSAMRARAGVLVAPFADPIGRDAIVQWPGGVTMQFYWHTNAPSGPPLATIPENRVYVARKQAEEFVVSFLLFSKGRLESDDQTAPGVEIGRPGATFRRIRLVSDFGRMTVLATDGWLSYPYGREINGYEVTDLAVTLAKAEASGAKVLVGPYKSDGREAMMVEFPGGYIAEVHATTP
jgi:hypothetical protein